MDSELLAAGFSPSAPLTVGTPHDLSFPSPDGRCTVLAEFLKGRGFNWGLRSLDTGKRYFFTKPVRPDDAFPESVCALWNPSSNYVAINTDEGGGSQYLDVVRISGGDAQFTSLQSCCSVLFDTLLEGDDQSRFSWWMSRRCKALRWKNETDLLVIVFTLSNDGNGGIDCATAAHETLRFEGPSYRVLSKNYDFCEKFPIPD